jgi:prepilin-type processing-associated H-X9-DG protein
MISIFICPSEVRQVVSTHDYGQAGILNYGWCMGDWFVWGGFNGPENRTSFGPNRFRQWADFRDGTSQTMLAAEVKAYQPVYICDNVGLSQINNPASVPPPWADSAAVAPEYISGCRLYLLGHTEWADGNVHATGFSTAWPPNRATLGQPTRDVDMDLNGINEEDGGPTFAAITARAYHPGGVNVLLADASVRFVRNDIDGLVWRAIGSVADGEARANAAF